MPHSGHLILVLFEVDVPISAGIAEDVDRLVADVELDLAGT